MRNQLMKSPSRALRGASLPAESPPTTAERQPARLWRNGFIAHGAVFFFLFVSPGSEALAQKTRPDISDITLDALANAEITSVSRKEEKLSQTAAAAFVITQEDIRRSGATSIPEVLRMVPGMDVAQIDANKWAITSRGFNERFADKVLVMIDGRAVLTPLSSGVNWDAQDTILDDIERIEVIRGPGASVWGANAVNGVINIITKKAKDTQGGLVTEGGGSQERESGAVRYGGAIGDRGFYRIFTKYLDREAFTDSSGRTAADNGKILRGGFRTDWNLSARDDLTVQGDLYSGNEGQTVTGLLSLAPDTSGNFLRTFTDRTNLSGGNVLGRWHHTSSERLDTTAQLYAELDDRSQAGVLGEFRHTVDVELEQHFTSGRHDLVWGGDYRYTADRTAGSLNMSFDPVSRSTNLFGAFIQDEITLLPDRLRATLGVKLEHNSYSGFALDPNFRLFWTVRPRYSVWLGISRASENSSRYDADIRTNEDASVSAAGGTTLVSSFGTHRLPPENVVAYELGQRAQVRKYWAFDVATFYNHYTNRHTQEPGVPFLEEYPEPLHLVLPTVTASNISGETHGIELSTTVKSTSLWKLRAGYTLFEIHLHAIPSSQDFSTARASEGSTPRHQFQVRLELNLPHKLEWDTAAYYVGSLPGPAIPRYTRVDTRLGWRPKAPLEISVGMQNLLDPRHFEFGSGDLVEATQIGRNAYGKLTWRF
jgi:iron complex outermembrane recepter protein